MAAMRPLGTLCRGVEKKQWLLFNYGNYRKSESSRETAAVVPHHERRPQTQRHSTPRHPANSRCGGPSFTPSAGSGIWRKPRRERESVRSRKPSRNTLRKRLYGAACGFSTGAKTSESVLHPNTAVCEGRKRKPRRFPCAKTGTSARSAGGCGDEDWRFLAKGKSD